MLVGVAAPNQRRSQLVHPSRPFHTFHHLVLAMKVIARVRVGVKILQHIGRREVIALDPGVGACGSPK